MASSKEYQMLFQLSANMNGGFSSTFSAGQKAVSELQSQINALNRTQADITAYEKQQIALDKSKEKLALYQSQLERLQGVEATSANEAAHLANEIEAKQNQVNNAQAAVDKNNAKLSDMGEALRQAGVDTNNLSSESARLKAEAEGVATAQLKEAQAAEEAGKSLQESMQGIQAGLEAVGAMNGLQALYNALQDCSQQAAAFETSMASVKRTVGGDDEFISDLGERFKQLSTEIPITAAELAGIASSAGQLGIAQENVESFTQVMAMLGTTTDLTADNAATMLAQFANITGVTDYERLGSTVAALGDSTATTASKVVEMSQGMAAAASIAGMSETDILAISAAVGSLGIEAQAGSTSMSQLISTLYKATETGDGLEEFASVAGMSAAQFKQAWGTDAVGAMNAFIQGLNDTERNGRSAVVILDELGISNVRQTKTILGLASAGDLLSNTIAQANSAWSSNSALAEKAGVMYGTTEAKMAMLQNAANNVQVAIGDALNPALQAGADAMTSLVEPVAEFLQQNPAVVQAITTFAGVLGVAVTGISAYTAATKLAAAASKLLGTSLSGYIGPVLAIAGGLSALVGIISAISSANQDATKSFEELQAEYADLQDALEDNQHVIDLVDQFTSLSGEVKKIQNLEPGDIELKAKIEASGLTDENLQKIDELKARIDTETGEIKQILSIAGAENVTEENLQAITDLANASADGDYELKQQLQIIGAANVTDEDIKRIKELSANVTDGAHDLKQQLSLMGADNISDDDLKRIQELANNSADGDYALKQQLSLMGADEISDTDMARLKELSDAIISESGILSETLQLTGFENYESMKAAAELPISSKTAKIMVDLQANGYDDLKQKLSEIGADVLSAQQAVEAAEGDLSTMQAQAQKIQETIDATRNNRQKNVLLEELTTLNSQIDEQSEKVTSLQEIHASLVEEYEATAAAASEVKEKEDALQATKAALTGVVGDLTTATEEETAALLEQQKATAEVNKALIMSEIYTNLSAQAHTYAAAVRDATTAGSGYESIQKRINVAAQYQGKTADEVNSAYQGLLITLNQMEQAEGFDPSSADYQSAIEQVTELRNIFGDYSSDLSEFAGQGIDWVDTFGYLYTTENAWKDSLSHMSDSLVLYQEELNSAKAQQTSFLDLLASGVTSGAVSLEEIQVRLSQAFAEEENGEELLSKAMEYVTNKVKEQTEATEAAAEAQGELAQATEELNGATEEQGRTIDDIIADINNLNKAYEESYQSAYESMTGQFDLFEKVNKVSGKSSKVNGGSNSYVEGLKSQTDYINQYTDNYEKAAASLQAAETAIYGENASHESSSSLLAQLADGSAESAQILADIAAAAPEDVQTLITEYEKSQEAADEFAQKVAETETNFDETMTKLKTELEAVVQSMDFSTEASQNASSSLDAFIASIKSYDGQAYEAAQQVAAAVQRGLQFNATVTGHAAGTDSAEPGYALVGEHGPELVYLHGGERILNAQETENALALKASPIQAEPAQVNTSEGGTTYQINVSIPSIDASGIDPYELRDMIVEDLGDAIEEKLKEIEEDEDRRNY